MYAPRGVLFWDFLLGTPHCALARPRAFPPVVCIVCCAVAVVFSLLLVLLCGCCLWSWCLYVNCCWFILSTSPVVTQVPHERVLVDTAEAHSVDSRAGREMGMGTCKCERRYHIPGDSRKLAFFSRALRCF